MRFLGGKRHNRVHPGHFPTQQGTPFYPASTNQLRSFQLDKKEYPVVSQNDLGAPCCVVSPFFFLIDSAFREIMFSLLPATDS